MLNIFTDHSYRIAFALVISLTAAILIIRKRAWSKATGTLLWAGVSLLCLAALSPTWNLNQSGNITVMVDLSASTRGARFRDEAYLHQRISELIGSTPHQIISFTDDGDKTTFTPPPASAILLFSDGQFTLPAYAPPIFPVMDPDLESPVDAAVLDLSIDGNIVRAAVSATGPPAQLNWTNAKPTDSTPITGDRVAIATRTDHKSITATFTGHDLWPENDSLSIEPSPPDQYDQWYVGSQTNPFTSSTLPPDQLPSDAVAYLNTGTIVLDNISADALSSLQQQRLAQYVQDIGGLLIILGGDHAFAAGHYFGTPLDSLSPLASAPPTPETTWNVLIDSSGSMASPIGHEISKLAAEVKAIQQLLPSLPPNDLVSIGTFSENINWLLQFSPAEKALSALVPPQRPTGPTNLQPALESAIDSLHSQAPSRLILLTDAESSLQNVPDLIARFGEKHLRLYVLAFGTGPALDDLKTLAESTGGSLVHDIDESHWGESAKQLARSAMPNHLSREKIQFQFEPSTGLSGSRSTTVWNATWAKPGSNLLARHADSPIASEWRIGSGRVLAVASSLSDEDIKALANKFASIPADPRFKISSWFDSQLHLHVDAVDGQRYLNDLKFRLELKDMRSGAISSRTLSQTAPGGYECELPNAASPRVAMLFVDNTPVKRWAVAGRYPAEFAAIGNNRQNLKDIADRTGGTVIEMNQHQPIVLPKTTKPTNLLPLLSTLAAFFIGAGLFRWKNRGE